MRFWLRWAIVTPPLAVCVFLWVQSYWFADTFQWDRPSRVLVFRFNDGTFDLAISVSKPPPGSVSSTQRWLHTRQSMIKGDDSVNRRVLGFGWRRMDFVPNFSFIVAELPIWAPTLLCAFPPLWLYRRQRKRPKIGFPVEPVAANSKGSTPAQTA
jgi:hypothetical protein